tara:strand:+ start:142 stop:774 length:633 start_codon:yes stop_codon:yes gene_type:complete
MIKLIYFEFNFWRIDISKLSLSYSEIPYKLEKLPRNEFFKKKKSGFFPFGQLPVMIIDKKMYGQTLAIAKFCASKSGLYGKNDKESLVIDQVLNWANDINTIIAPSIREKNREKQLKLRKNFVDNHLMIWFNFLEKLFLKTSKNKKFFTDRFSLADITAWRVIHWFISGKLELIDPKFIMSFKNLQKFYTGIYNKKSFNKLKEFEEIISN